MIDVTTTITAALVAVSWGAMAIADRHRPYGAGEAAALACAFGGLTVWHVTVYGGDVLASTGAGLAGWFAWIAWTRRKPRQRRPSRLSSLVRDLGHRLAVSST